MQQLQALSKTGRIAPARPDTRRRERASRQPDVTGDYEVQFRQPDIDAILHFLCDEREFSRERVEAALKRTYQSGCLFH